MQALAQSVIAGKTVYLQGAKITPAQVASFVDHKRKQLRSGVFLIDQLEADIDASAMAIIELKLVAPTLGRGVFPEGVGGDLRNIRRR